MSRKLAVLAVGLMGGLVLCAAGCLLAGVEGAKAAHVAIEGVYEEATPVAAGALAQYKGYRMGACLKKNLTVPADTKEADKPKAQEQIDSEMQRAQEVVAVLPERFSEYMVNDAKLQPGATPTLLITVRDVHVTQRTGVLGVLLPNVQVTSVVTLADAQTGQVLGVANVSGHTSSRVLGSARQLANFIGRGTGKWIIAKR